MKKQNLDKLGLVTALGAMMFLGAAMHYLDAAIHVQHAPFLPGTQEAIRVDYQCPLCQFLSQAHFSNQFGEVGEIFVFLRTLHQARPGQGHPEQLYVYAVFSR
jgi:rubredoxin